jgi:hypothetical protein
MTNKPLRPKPAPKKSEIDLDFVLGNEEDTPESSTTPHQTKPNKVKSKKYPWQDKSLRSDVIKGYNVRLNEPLYVKLKWLADNSPESLHKILLEGIEREAARRLKKMGVKT